MVYEGSRSGLNDVLWAPLFALPTVTSMCCTIGVGYWCADNDFGELREYCGVDISQLYPEEWSQNKDNPLTRAWTRSAMGFCPSPYQAVQGALRAKRVAPGDRHNEKNVFAWSTVELNLPGSSCYDPAWPWISNRRADRRIASYIHLYVNDNRETAATQELAWRASSQMAKTCAWLGLQDAAWKRREPSVHPGAWAGSVVHVEDDAVYKLVIQERWDKTKAKIDWI